MKAMRLLISRQIVDFDKSVKKKDDQSLKHMWAVISAISLWLNEVDQQPLIRTWHGRIVWCQSRTNKNN
jgi:hypothetical protein